MERNIREYMDKVLGEMDLEKEVKVVIRQKGKSQNG